jgi:hypothetical protein
LVRSESRPPESCWSVMRVSLAGLDPERSLKDAPWPTAQKSGISRHKPGLCAGLAILGVREASGRRWVLPGRRNVSGSSPTGPTSDRTVIALPENLPAYAEFTPSNTLRSTATIATALVRTQIDGLESRNRSESHRTGMPDCTHGAGNQGHHRARAKTGCLHVKGLKESQRPRPHLLHDSHLDFDMSKIRMRHRVAQSRLYGTIFGYLPTTRIPSAMDSRVARRQEKGLSFAYSVRLRPVISRDSP